MPEAVDRNLAEAALLRRIGARELRIGTLGPGDGAQVERLFARAFGRAPEAGWHAWKYGVLAGSAVGLWDETGELVAHYAGFPRSLLWQGRPLSAIQIGDVMVAPEMRGLLTRRGPFFQVCSRFFADRVGAGREFALAYGFPNERAIRLGTALGLYHDLDHIHRLVWPARPARLPLDLAWLPLDADDGLERHVAAAWEEMRSDLGDHVLGLRDTAYVTRRFLRRPGGDYRFFRLRRRLSGKTAAVAVLRLAPGRAELIDLIGPRKALNRAARAAAAEAGRAGAAHLEGWGSAAVAAALRESGAVRSGEAAHFAVARASRIACESLAAARWWWLGGDSDFL